MLVKKCTGGTAHVKSRYTQRSGAKGMFGESKMCPMDIVVTPSQSAPWPWGFREACSRSCSQTWWTKAPETAGDSEDCCPAFRGPAVFFVGIIKKKNIPALGHRWSISNCTCIFCRSHGVLMLDTKPIGSIYGIFTYTWMVDLYGECW